MIEFTVCFSCIDQLTGQEMSITEQFEMEDWEELPSNNREDIEELIADVRVLYRAKGYEPIDVFEIVDKNGNRMFNEQEL